MSHIVGRPNDDLLAIMLNGAGADPEQAFIGGSEQGPEEGEGDEATVPRVAGVKPATDH